MVSPVPRPTEDLTHSGLESGFVSSVSSDMSDLCSAERSPASDHQQWALAGDGGSGGRFPLPSGHPSRRRKSCTRVCTPQTGLTDTRTTSDK